MHQLLLLRHAKSSWDDPSLSDRDRSLNKRGRRSAALMRGVMHELGLAPDVVLVSAARRTLETLAALEPWDETPLVEPMEALYLASAEQMLAILHGIAETARSVLVIGHNPGMHELAAMLIAGHTAVTHGELALASGFPTAALAEFSIASTWWQLAAGGGRLVRFVTPRDLRDGDLLETAT